MRDTRRNPPPKLLATVRQVLRWHHGSIHTERSAVAWIVRFVRSHGLQSPANLCPTDSEIELFPTDLAV